MKNCLKTLLVTTILTAAATPSFAQSSSTEARLQALEAMVQQLKAELAAERAQTDSEIVQLKSQPAPIAGKTAGKADGSGFQVGDTTFKIGGFIDLDAHVTNTSDGSIGSSSIARDFYVPSVTPVGGGDDSTVTDFTAQATRLSVSASRPTENGPAKAHLEMDFLGSAQGNERVSNSYSPRLRRAFLDYNSWRIGQEWTTFQNTSAIPESASFLALSDGMAFLRQPMLRYTNGNWQFAAETGNATVTNTAGVRVEADSNLLPDLIARYNFKGDYGNVSVGGLARQLRYEAGPVDEEVMGYGLSVSGRVKVGEKDDIRFNLMGGEGLGRYAGLNAFNGAALDPSNGELDTIGSFGGLIAYRHPFAETARWNIGYSFLEADNPNFLTALNPNKSVQSAYTAFLWDIAPKVTVGVEGMYGQRELENGDDGTLSRLTFSTKYGF